MALLIILATATAAYFGSPWWVALLGAGFLFAGSLSATASIRSNAVRFTSGGLFATYAISHAALNATAASAAAFLLGIISRHLWG
jgi:uncharacterized membrane protein YecN with MAPEG domain